MTIRRLTHDDLMALNELWSVCYLFESNPESIARRLENDPHTPYGYGAFLGDGTMISAVLGNPFEMVFAGKRTSLCGIGGVVTRPTHRRLGAVRGIMQTILREQYEEGTVFSGLYPFQFAFYRKFGYELAAAQRETRLPLSELRPYANKCDARFFTDKDDVSALLDVFNAFARRYSLAIARTPAMLREKLKPNPFAGNAYLYAIYEDNSPVAYVFFHKQAEKNGNTLAVDDLAFIKPAHFRALMGFLSGMEAEFRDLRIVLPADIDLSVLVADPYSVQTSIRNRYMMRVVNCEKALGMLDLLPGETFSIQISDAFLPENSGTWQVSAQGVHKTTAPADISLSIQAFSQLLCGMISLDTALYRNDVTVSCEKTALRRIFTQQPSYIGTDY